jgi:hypothetical protein
MNSIMNLLGGGNGNIMMQAFGAMMRGENPRQFLSNLAQNNPQLKGLDLNNLEQTAKQVCDSNGVDMSSKMKELNSYISNFAK